MEQIYLSKRNLQVLLSKLDRLEKGETTACSIIKFKNADDVFKNSMDKITVTAVADDEYYVNRKPGAMHPADLNSFQNVSDVHTRDAPSSVLFNLSEILNGSNILVGYEFGKNTRNAIGLDILESKDNIKIVIELDDNVYSMSSSFFRGMFEPSFEKFNSREKFNNKYTFKVPDLIKVIIDSGISRFALSQEVEKFNDIGNCKYALEGYLACERGLGISDNPYVPGYSEPFTLAYKWQSGYDFYLLCAKLKGIK